MTLLITVAVRAVNFILALCIAYWNCCIIHTVIVSMPHNGDISHRFCPNLSACSVQAIIQSHSPGAWKQVHCTTAGLSPPLTTRDKVIEATTLTLRIFEVDWLCAWLWIPSPWTWPRKLSMTSSLLTTVLVFLQQSKPFNEQPPFVCFCSCGRLN